jgi:hypothetical protein
MKKLLAIITATVLLSFSALTAFASPLTDVLNYYKLNQNQIATFEDALALAQQGYILDGTTFSVDPTVANATLDAEELEDATAAKYIFLAIASGKTPLELAKIDVVSILKNMQDENGLFNFFLYSHCTDMLALDMAKADYDVTKAINALLTTQAANGAWQISDWFTGNLVDDIDTTAMALLVFANHKDIAGVNEAITKGLAFLKTAQNADGGYTAWGSDSVSSAAIVLLALVDNGFDVANSDYSKIITKLNDFKNNDGSYSYASGAGTADAFSTRQVFLALSALNKGKSAFKHIISGGTFASVENITSSATSSVSSATSSTSSVTTDSNPKTSDNILLYFIITIFSAGAIFITSKQLILKRNAK